MNGEQEVGAIDQNLANNLEAMDRYTPDSDKRMALLEENKFYEAARIDEMKTELAYRQQYLAEEQMEFDKQKHRKDTIVRIVDIAVKGAVGLVGIAVGAIVAFGELDLEENGANRSKAAQKFGSFFKPGK